MVTVVQLLLPILFTILSCLLLNIKVKDSPALNLGFQHFESPIVPYTAEENGYSQVKSLVNDMEGFLSGKASFLDVSESDKGYNNLSDYIVDIGKDDLNEYTNVYLVGAHFEGGYNDSTDTHLLKGYYNGESIHSSPLAMNAIGNTLLRYFTGMYFHSRPSINRTHEN